MMTFAEYCEVIGCPVDELDRGDRWYMRGKFSRVMVWHDDPTMAEYVVIFDAATAKERRADLLADYRADIAADVALTVAELAR